MILLQKFSLNCVFHAFRDSLFDFWKIRNLERNIDEDSEYTDSQISILHPFYAFKKDFLGVDRTYRVDRSLRRRCRKLLKQSKDQSRMPDH